MSKKKILVIPPMPWYMANYAEYLVRYLSDEFLIEVADVPYEPYTDFLSRFPETNPLQRNPDDYDLLVPLLASHWVVTDKEKYKEKIALIWYQPNEGNFYPELAGLAACTPMAEQSINNYKYHSVRWGVDTEIFKPLGHKHDGFVVGMVGNLFNPRRMTKVVYEALKDLEGVNLKFFVGKRPQSFHDIELLGAPVELIQGGEKDSIGLANIYNSLDVLIRCDSDPGVSFPVMEAASCGVPVIATNSGIDHEIVNGGGILIDGDRQYYQSNENEVGKKIRDAVIQMRDNPMERITMGKNARQKIEDNFTWDKHIEGWRKFFREATHNAGSKS